MAESAVGAPLVEPHHHAPVAHFSGVPPMAEIPEARPPTWGKPSAPWNDVSNPLPGMAALVSAVAGRPLGPGRLLRDIGDDAARALEGTEVEVVG